MSSRGNDARLRCWAAAGLLLTGCMLGGDEDDSLSPYQKASIIVANPVGVADGLTGVQVDVSGDVGSRLVLEIIGAGTFLNPDPGTTQEKTLFLAEVDGTGHATAEVVATRAGDVAVAFKPDPLRGPQEIRFLPVVLAAGAPKAQVLHPGLVETEVCFAINTAQGLLVTRALIDPEAPPEEADPVDEGPIDIGDGFEFAPAPGVQATALIGATPPEGLDCPAADTALDEIGWVGYAKMFVRTDLEHAFLSLDYQAQAGSSALYNRQVELFLAPFPGYAVTAEATDQVDYLQVDIHVDYAMLDDLGGTAAEGVELTSRFIPDPGPDLLGSSAGGVDDPLVTDAAGNLTLFLDNSAVGTYVWFITLSGGVQVRLDDLTI